MGEREDDERGRTEKDEGDESSPDEKLCARNAQTRNRIFVTMTWSILELSASILD